MKIGLFLFFIFIPISNGFAQTNLFLFGQGISDSSTQEALALACKDSIQSPAECKKIGFLYYHPQDGNQWLPLSFQMPIHTSSEAMMNEAIQVQLKYILMRHNPNFCKEEWSRILGLNLFNPARLLPHTPNYYDGSITKAAINKAGWNWSSRAQKTKSKKFQHYLRVLKNDRVSLDACSATFDILALKADLYRQGVRFLDGERLFLTRSGKSNFGKENSWNGIDWDGSWYVDE